MVYDRTLNVDFMGLVTPQRGARSRYLLSHLSVGVQTLGWLKEQSSYFVVSDVAK